MSFVTSELYFVFQATASARGWNSARVTTAGLPIAVARQTAPVSTTVRVRANASHRTLATATTASKAETVASPSVIT
jgi:hypothetical protein